MVLLSGKSPGQDTTATRSFDPEIRFLFHLSAQSMHRDVLFGANRRIGSLQSSPFDELDSLWYIKAWSHYQLKEADSAWVAFRQVRRSAQLGPKAHYYGLFNGIYAGLLDSARYALEQDTTASYADLIRLDLAGIALLKRDFTGYDSLARQFTFANYTMSDEEHHLNALADTLRHRPKKSAVLAATMSALLPGSGKVYAGNTGQGIAAFLEIAALGLAAGEYYYKSGPQSAGFIVFGTLFTCFYIGNIWGSALAIHVNRIQFDERIDQNIYVDLHLPLRRIFN